MYPSIFHFLKFMFVFMITVGMGNVAFADSYWNHDGSVVRLSSDGNNRRFSYASPNVKLQSMGINKDALLFEGERQKDQYRGRVNVALRGCSKPISYEVTGDVLDNQTKVVLVGTRQSYDGRCRPTGHYVTETLEFDYMYKGF